MATSLRNFNYIPLILAFAAFVIVVNIWHSDNLALPAKAIWSQGKKTSTVAGSSISTTARLSFLDIAKKHGTDKVTTHNYHYMYEKYLEPIRYRKLKVLEIGLGCNMNYGPGASYSMWLEFFPNVDLYFIEVDGECVKKWETKTSGATIYTGDQADTTFLESVISKSGGNFDIIIDDGGHTMTQQMTSLNTLWKSVLAGGIYFCEDLATSYSTVYGGGPNQVTMYTMIKELLDDLNHETEGRPAVKHSVGNDMRSIDCGEEICAFVKKS